MLSLITTRREPRPADFAAVRSTNLAVVLRFIRQHAPCSRADIAAATGLNKATVSSLVAELIERRLISEVGLTEHRIGRPAMMLTLDGHSYAAIGLAVEVDHLSAVALDIAGRQILAWHRSFDARQEGPDRTVARLAALARRAVTRVKRNGGQVLGLGVAVPGLVAVPERVVRLAPRLGWRDLPLGTQLEAALRSPEFPIMVDNDANLAAVAEHRCGSHAGTPHLLYLGGQYGAGAGVLIDGRVPRGAHGFGGQLAHLPVAPRGPACPCGQRGCLDVVAAPTTLSPTGEADTTVEDLEAVIDDVVARAEAGHDVTLKRLERLGGWLGRGAATVVTLADPAVVILGGHYARLARWLEPAASTQLRQGALTAGLAAPSFVASTLGMDAPARGAAAYILDAVDDGEIPLLSSSSA